MKPNGQAIQQKLINVIMITSSAVTLLFALRSLPMKFLPIDRQLCKSLRHWVKSSPQIARQLLHLMIQRQLQKFFQP